MKPPKLHSRYLESFDAIVYACVYLAAISRASWGINELNLWNLMAVLEGSVGLVIVYSGSVSRNGQYLRATATAAVFGIVAGLAYRCYELPREGVAGSEFTGTILAIISISVALTCHYGCLLFCKMQGWKSSLTIVSERLSFAWLICATTGLTALLSIIRWLRTFSVGYNGFDFLVPNLLYLGLVVTFVHMVTFVVRTWAGPRRYAAITVLFFSFYFLLGFACFLRFASSNGIMMLSIDRLCTMQPWLWAAEETPNTGWHRVAPMMGTVIFTELFKRVMNRFLLNTRSEAS